MKTIFVGAGRLSIGKSTTCVCLGKMLQEKGLRIGYFKPCGTWPVRSGGATHDEDAARSISLLGLDDDPADVCPYVLTHDFKVQVLRGRVSGAREKILDCFSKISKGKDVVIVEGGRTMQEGRALDYPSEEFINDTGAGLIYVEHYENDRGLDHALDWKAKLGDRFLGMILNRVGEAHDDFIRKLIVPFLEARGIKVLGVLPDDPVVGAISVGEAAEFLNGHIVTAPQMSETLLNRFMVGAMNTNAAVEHFRKVKNKAVITGGDRTDMQAAALDTSTLALILTGGIYPHPVIMQKADDLNVPVIVVSCDTTEALDKVDALLKRPGLAHPERIARALEIFGANVNFELP